MKQRCFDCGQELRPVVSCKDSYLCEKCDKIWFLQRIYQICYKCNSHINTQYQLVSFEDYQAKPIIKEPVICAMCYGGLSER